MKILIAMFIALLVSGCMTAEQRQLKEQERQAEQAQKLADTLKVCGVEDSFEDLADDPFKQEVVIECMKKSGYSRIDNQWQ